MPECTALCPSFDRIRHSWRSFRGFSAESLWQSRARRRRRREKKKIGDRGNERREGRGKLWRDPKERRRRKRRTDGDGDNLSLALGFASHLLTFHGEDSRGWTFLGATTETSFVHARRFARHSRAPPRTHLPDTFIFLFTLSIYLSLPVSPPREHGHAQIKCNGSARCPYVRHVSRSPISALLPTVSPPPPSIDDAASRSPTNIRARADADARTGTRAVDARTFGELRAKRSSPRSRLRARAARSREHNLLARSEVGTARVFRLRWLVKRVIVLSYGVFTRNHERRRLSACFPRACDSLTHLL